MNIRQWVAVQAINLICTVADVILDALVVVLESPSDEEIEEFISGTVGGGER